MTPEEIKDNETLLKTRLRINSVVQINEHGMDGWIGCLVQVTEVKSWGIQGYVQIPKGGQAFIRLNFSSICYIGEAVMVQSDPEEITNNQN